MIYKHLYRQGVGSVIINKDNLVFVAKRVDTSLDWQMPQGGIDMGEMPKDALLREVLEETGISKLEILGQTPLLSYNIPPHIVSTVWEGRYVGQQQIWFFARFLGEESEINLNYHTPPEFNAYKWVDYNELPELIIPFKRNLYEEIVSEGEKLGILKK